MQKDLEFNTQIKIVTLKDRKATLIGKDGEILYDFFIYSDKAPYSMHRNWQGAIEYTHLIHSSSSISIVTMQNSRMANGIQAKAK